MTTAEFSVEFDVLYNNITSNQAPGLTDYEKSVFLTKAQNQLVQEYFNPALDGAGGGFDGSPKRQIDFSSIMDWEVLDRITQSIPKYDPRSIVYAMPKNLLLVLDEQLSLLDYSNVSYSQADNDTFYSVVPLSFEEYNKFMAKPYKYPPKGQAWRLIVKKRSISISGKIPTESPTYETIHSKGTAYAKVRGTTKAIFTIEFDSYDDNHDAIKLAFVTDGFDTTDLESNNYTIVEIQASQMNTPIQSFLNDWASTQKLNNLRIIFESGYKLPTWADLWGTESLILKLENSGSVPTEPQISPDTLEVRQLVEIIGNFPSTPFYRMRYIRKPSPIVLENLVPYSVSIEGVTAVTNCELPDEVHHEILERAVTLAKIAWQGTTMTQTALAVEAEKN